MPHLHTNPGEHDHTISIYVFRTDFAEPKIMLHFHRKLHSYMQFGGHIELNEHPGHTLAHELREESGYELSQMRILQPHVRVSQLSGAITHPQPVVHNTHRVGSDHFHTDSVYALITNEIPKHQPAEGESTDIQLFTRSEILDLPSDKIIENVREVALFIFDNCLPQWKSVALDEFESE